MLLLTLVTIVIGHLTVYSVYGQSSPVPLVISPTGNWIGPDGPWATFEVGAGEPMQTVQTLPSTSVPGILLPKTADWCPLNYTFCKERGSYDFERSTTWSSLGQYNLPLPSNLFPDGDASLYGSWGLDTFTFGSSGNDISLGGQMVTTILTPQIPIGLFGLADGSIVGDVRRYTVLQNLKTSGQIASFSFGYTAGSVNRDAPASLVLGGYDASRLNLSSTVYFSIGGDYNTTLLVDISLIEIETDDDILQSIPTSNYSISQIAIDSSIAQLSLPVDVCRYFEDAFHLTWDSEFELYLVNKTIHEQLLKENSSVIFTFPSKSGGTDTRFTFPYSAFDLNVTYPLVNVTSYYFPLKRASNPEQSVLGRVFLQETYLTVDYGRRNFSIAQSFPGGNPRIISITDPESLPSTPTSEPTSTADSTEKPATQPSDVYFGVGIAIGLPTLIVILVLILWRKRWGPFQSRDREKGQKQERFDKVELGGEGKPWIEVTCELETIESGQEVGGSLPLAAELDGRNNACEMDATDRGSTACETDATDGASTAFEMDATPKDEIASSDSDGSSH